MVYDHTAQLVRLRDKPPVDMRARDKGLTVIVGLALVALPQLAHAQQSCASPVAVFESVKNTVQLLQASTRAAIPAARQVQVCAGDTIEVGDNSRAVLLMIRSNTPLVIDQNSEFVVTDAPTGSGSFVNLVKGALLFITRVKRSIEIRTPFVNAAIEGTEFVVRVLADRTVITVYEGTVRATTIKPEATLLVGAGQQAVAIQGQAPQLQLIVRPRDAVQWALYYEPVLPSDSFAQLGTIPQASRDVTLYIRRASLLLGAGQLDEARADLDRAQNLDPSNGNVYALRAVVSVAVNDKQGALDSGHMAVERAPQSSAARLALSYALQSNFDLEAARDVVAQAVEVQPNDAAAWARLAELRLMLDDVGGAVDAARRSVMLSPQLARGQTVLGFTLLAELKPSDARAAFDRAIDLEPDNPMARLGLGLARIRQGRLAEGRRDLEIAMALNPDNALIRSYLGKAYFEEKREPLPAEQYELAKRLDPLDPTASFYDAIRKQTLNRPIEALLDIERSIALNDDRAVYRSRLLLDQDQAARNTSLARLYRDLGFEQLALIEASKSLDADQAEHSSHRFLSEAYATLPRHEVARVSEVLQAQLLQLTSLTPVPARLAETDSFILEGAGPDRIGFNEFNPLFSRNRAAVQFNGTVGNESVFSDDATVSGIWNRLSFSVGQFHYDTDGFRVNNDQKRDLYDGFVQVQVSTSTTIQTEFRSQRVSTGDVFLNFDPSDFSPNRREHLESDTGRLGFRRIFTPHSQIIGSFYWQSETFQSSDILDQGVISVKDNSSRDTDSWTGEIRHLFRAQRYGVTSGLGRFQSQRTRNQTLETRLPPPLPPVTISNQIGDNPEQTNAYTYALIDLSKQVAMTVGASVDAYRREFLERNQFNPKFGITWRALPSTTFRAAAFRTLHRAAVSSQTIEPTQVAGFSQLFADGEAEESRRYGIAVDQKIAKTVFGGAEYSRRDLRVPNELISQSNRTIEWLDRREELGRSYLYWTPEQHVSLSLDYVFERFDNSEFIGEEGFLRLRTHRLPLGINYFGPSGLLAHLKAIYIDQIGTFPTNTLFPATTSIQGEDRFWVVDASIGYRLPKRYGRLTFEAKNLFNEKFHFQDTDPGNPQVRPGRLAVLRVTLGM